MKCLALFTMALAVCGSAPAALLYQEAFNYPPADLSGNSGGTGWSTPWTDTGNPVVVATSGLSYSDPSGRALEVSGQAVNTADGGNATTISTRETGPRDQELWISMLIKPEGSNSDFVGISFYQGGLALANARFAIELAGSAGSRDLRLTRRAAGSPAPPVYSPAFTPAVGSTAFCVMHLVPDGGSGEIPLDRIDVYFNPLLGQEPISPHASLEIDGLQFDRIRVAAQNGRSTLVDEIRIGTTWEDVSPHTTPSDTDSDFDGLTDSQEIELGLDPEVSDATLIAALRANAEWFSLHAPAEISDVTIGGLSIRQNSPVNFDYTFDLRDRFGHPTETIDRPLTAAAKKLFLRLKISAP